jgi:exodeoxyribonuclease VII large subunit
VRHQLDRADDDLGHQLARVRGMSPLATLRRGYAIVQNADRRVVTTAEQAAPEQTLQIRVAEGRIRAVVTESTPVSEVQT